VPTTQKTTTAPKTTTSHVPIDPTTSTTTTKTPETTAKPHTPDEGSHFIRWFFGKFIIVIIFILAFQQKLIQKIFMIICSIILFLSLRYVVPGDFRGDRVVVRLQILPEPTGLSLSEFIRSE
jgi:hypothetical protein